MKGQYITVNMFGYKGVWYDQKKDRYFATVCPAPKKRVRSKPCLSAKDAAIQYDILTLEHCGDERALNFPTKGQKQVVRIEKKNEICLNGHDVSIIGRSPSGNCRQCNREAVAKYKKNKDILKNN